MIEEKRIQQEIDLQTYLNNLILDDKQRSGVTGSGVTGLGVKVMGLGVKVRGSGEELRKFRGDVLMLIPKKSEAVQIRELLNIDPQCHEEDKPLAQNIICSFVNHVYNIVNTSLSELIFYPYGDMNVYFCISQ